MTGHLDRTIGLGGTVATLIGYVIGASIFILPGELAASSGPAIALSYLLAAVLIFYGLVSVVLPGIIPWTELATTDAPVATAAATFLPPSVAGLISLGALLASATTINGILLGQSRDLLALARDRILPAAFGRLHPRFHSPHVAVMVLGLLSLGGIAVGASITEYATVGVLGFMTFQMFSGTALYLLPARTPERFARAAFRLAPFWRVFFGLGLVVLSVLFVALAGLQNRRAVMLFAIYMAVGAGYYRWRRRHLAAHGVDLDTTLRQDP